MSRPTCHGVVGFVVASCLVFAACSGQSEQAATPVVARETPSTARIVPSAAQLAAAPWRLVAQVAPSTSVLDAQYQDMSAASASDIWAVGSVDLRATGGATHQPLVEHWDGASWRRVSSPPVPRGALEGGQLTTVVANKSGVWTLGFGAFGHDEQNSFVSYRIGSRWVTHNLGTRWNAGHLAVFGRNDVWVLGQQGTSSHLTGRYAHWTGRRWTTGRLPALPEANGQGDVAAAWAPAKAGIEGGAELLHWNGHAWVRVTAPDVTKPREVQLVRYNDVLDLGRGNVWLTVAFGVYEDDSPAPGLLLYHRVRGAWHRVLSLPVDQPMGIASDGHGGLWLLSSGNQLPQLLHVVHGKLARRVSAPVSAGSPLDLAAFVRAGTTSTLTTVGQITRGGFGTAVIETYRP